MTNAPADFVDAAIAFCTQHLDRVVRCHEAYCSPVTKLRGESNGTDSQRLTLLTNEGTFEFFVKVRFAESSAFMSRELRRASWPVDGVLFLPEILIVRHDRHSVAISPAVTEKGVPAHHLWKRLEIATESEKQGLAQRLALAMTQFDRVFPGQVSLEVECRDIMTVHHISTAVLPEAVAAELHTWLPAWQSLVDGVPTGLSPRDYYANLLVGAPLFASSRSLPLTLIDFGESYKATSAAERLAQSLVACKYEARLSVPEKRRWMRQLCAFCLALNVDLHPLRLYLGLWGLRWALWKSSAPRTCEGSLSLIRRSVATTGVNDAVEACIEFA
jgi:hypothetical protein